MHVVMDVNWQKIDQLYIENHSNPTIGMLNRVILIEIVDEDKTALTVTAREESIEALKRVKKSIQIDNF